MSTAKDRPKPLAWLTPRERAAYIGLVALRSATGVLDVCGLLLIGLLVAVATGSSAAQRPLAMLGMDPEDVDTSTIMVLVALVAALFLAKAAVGVGAARTLAWYVAVIEARRADDIADYVFSDDLTTLDGRDRGQIVWAITGSVSALFTGMLTVRAIMISETITAVLIGATIAVSNPIVGAGVLLYLVLLFWGIHMVVSRRIRRAGRQTARGSVGTGNALDDLIGSYREISVLGVREVFLSRLSVAKRAVALSTAVKLFLGAMPRYIAESGLMLGLVAFVAVEALSGNLAQNLPSLAIFLAGGVRLIGSLLPIQTAVGMGRNFAAQSDLASSLLRDRADAGSGAAAPAETDATPPADFTLVLDRVSYTHPGAAEAAVREISLEIPQGTRVAIVGPSGAGKSTLADLMLGLLSPAEGSVTLGGTPMRQARSGAAGAIAYVPQRPGIVEGTIADNIALGVPAEERSVRRLNAAVRAAHLGELLASLPQGLDTPVDPRSDSLSGGQLQRLGLARAFYHEPKLLVLDEPTSALDPQTEAAVADTLRLLGDDVTTVVIAHRLSTVQHADVVLVLDAGRVVASGSLSELATSNALVAEYVRLSTIALSA